MSPNNRQLLRAAAAIHSHIAGQEQTVGIVRLPESAWEGTTHLARKLERAAELGWHLAAQRLMQDLTYEVESLRRRLAEFYGNLKIALAPTTKPVLADIYADLLALSDEFDEVSFDGQELRVTTDAIELEGVYLGPFQICLDWKDRHVRPFFRVVAIDPHPAATNEGVTHPHVSDESLCVGDGREAIGAALESGRILDFFTIVERLLRTYAPGRAYVELADWFGTPCHDCSGIVDDDDRWTCEQCEATICAGCVGDCTRCGSAYCAECHSSCSACECSLCSTCFVDCRQCRQSVCTDCLENGLCPDCQPKESDDEDELVSQAAPAAS